MNELCETPVVKLCSNEVISLAGTHPCRRKLPEDFLLSLHRALSKCKCDSIGKKRFHFLSQNYHSETRQLKLLLTQGSSKGITQCPESFLSPCHTPGLERSKDSVLMKLLFHFWGTWGNNHSSLNFIVQQNVWFTLNLWQWYWMKIFSMLRLLC